MTPRRHQDSTEIHCTVDLRPDLFGKDLLKLLRCPTAHHNVGCEAGAVECDGYTFARTRGYHCGLIAKSPKFGRVLLNVTVRDGADRKRLLGLRFSTVSVLRKSGTGGHQRRQQPVPVPSGRRKGMMLDDKAQVSSAIVAGRLKSGVAAREEMKLD